MFKTLDRKIAALLLLVFGAIAVLLVLVVGKMLPQGKFNELVAGLIIGGIAFALLSALLLFHLITRRLQELLAAVETYRASNFSTAVLFRGADDDGDEIGRLAAAFIQMAARITEQLSILKQIDTQRRELMANVSHDLRTPLAAMQGYLETLLLKSDSLPPAESRSYLAIAHKHCERLTRLVANLFELTKLEAREVVPKPEPFSVAELVQDTAQKFELTARDKGVHLSASHVDVLPMALADIGLIERVLQNLIENAVRHTPAGGTVRLLVTRAGSNVRVEVTDSGAGISAQDLPHIFDRYYRAGAEHAAHSSGAGLGLAIVKRVLDLHGSRIDVRSEPGSGTTFGFELPQQARIKEAGLNGAPAGH
jgi:signal transduction histidine kinase